MTPNLHVVPDLDEVLIPAPPIPGDEPHVDDRVDAAGPVEVAEVVEVGAVPVDPARPDPDTGPRRRLPRPERPRARHRVDQARLQVLDRLWQAREHARRGPRYWRRAARYTHLGVWRLVVAWWRWQLDVEGAEDRKAVRSALGTSQGSGASHVTKAREDHLATRRSHLVIAGLVSVLVVAAVVVADVVAASVAGWWGLLALWAATWLTVIPLLGWAGRPADKRLTDRLTSSSRPVPFTSKEITGALSFIGVGKLNAATKNDPDAIGFPEPISREGQGAIRGWRALIELPRGVTVAEVSAKHDPLASALRIDPRRLILSQPKGKHPGLLLLLVLDDPLAEVPMPAWPLAERGTVNMLEPWPLGLNQRGETMMATLAFVAWLIGAMPRMGKTAAVRLFGLAAGLDVRCEIHVINCKGGGDFGPLKAICHTYISSARAVSRPAILADLLLVKLEMERRYDVLEQLTEDEPERCPEGKVTDALASDRALGLHPILLLLDEAHMAYGDPECGPEISALVEDLARRGPAVLITSVNASQRMDSGSIPRGVSATAARRLCLKTGDHIETDLILGTAATKRGAAAHLLTDTDVGVGYVTGEGLAPAMIRTFYVDLVDARPIVARALEARRRANRLTGMAAGESAPELGAGLAEHLEIIWPEGQKQARYGELVEALTATWPDRYAGWGEEQVSAGCRALGLPSIQVGRGAKGARTNRRGIRRSDLDALLARQAEALATATTGPIEDPEAGDDPTLVDHEPSEFDGVRGPWEDDDADELVAD